MILLLKVVIWAIFLFCICIMSGYLVLAFFSYRAMRIYFAKNNFSDYNILLGSSLAPPISLISPAYNESQTIVDNVRTQLSLNYNNYEIILVNDGSTDDSMEKLITNFNLEKRNIKASGQLITKKIRGIYKSTNPAYEKLTIVDKENGGKSDALNAGINLASANYVICGDTDCVLEQDSLLKMIKPFLDRTDNKRVIACGGVVRVANNCIIEDGRLIKVKIPESFLPRVQVLEYIRSFLLGRMAWSYLDGLLLISGAFGLFDKEILIKCGGYGLTTITEDMELVVRMRRYMHEHKEPYKVIYIPDPLCWTEVPESYQILGRQRKRWSCGLIKTLWLHRKVFFNPRYGVLGMVSYPYWLIYELLAPVIQAIGVTLTVILAFVGNINWTFCIVFLLFAYAFNIFFSLLAILAEEETYDKYKKLSDYFKLLHSILLEPIFFQPFVTFSALRGYASLLFKNQKWGKMTRKGFASKKS